MASLNSILAVATASVFLNGVKASDEYIKTTCFLGNTPSLSCSWNSTEPVSTVLWEFGEDALRHDTTDPEEKHQRRYTSSINNTAKTALLLIENVTFEDAGPYTCRLFYQLTGTSTKKITLQVQDGPRMSTDVFVSTEHDKIEAKCSVDFGKIAEVENEIIWFITGVDKFEKISEGLNQSSSGSKAILSSILTFRSDRSHHEEFLVCLMPNDLNMSTSAELLVNYSASVSLSNDTTILLTKAQMNLNITCLADGNPSPTVRLQHWVQEDQTWQVMQVIPISKGNKHDFWILVYTVAGRDQTFRCYAYNSIGEAAVSNEIRIISPDQVTVKMLNSSTLKLQKDQAAFISCESSGNPPPEVYLEKSLQSQNGWMTVDIMPLVETRDHSKLSTWALNINSAPMELPGTYRCTAFNDVSDIVYSKIVEIQIKPLPFSRLRDNIKLVIIICVGGLFIIILTGAGATKKKKSLQNFYNTIERRVYYDVSNNPTILSTPRPFTNSTGSIPDVCYHVPTVDSYKHNKQPAPSFEEKEKATYSEYDDAFSYSPVPLDTTEIPAICPRDDDYIEML